MLTLCVNLLTLSVSAAGEAGHDPGRLLPVHPEHLRRHPLHPPGLGGGHGRLAGGFLHRLHLLPLCQCSLKSIARTFSACSYILHSYTCRCSYMHHFMLAYVFCAADVHDSHQHERHRDERRGAGRRLVLPHLARARPRVRRRRRRPLLPRHQRRLVHVHRRRRRDLPGQCRRRRQ